MRRAVVATVIAAFALPASALAGVQLKSIDASQYPTIRLAAVTSKPTTSQPRLLENGRPVAGYTAQNLGRAKSIVLAIDRSKSMAGKSLVDAAAAARAFVGAKPAPDRIEVVAFGHQAVALTGFSTSTTDADGALRTLSVDAKAGTALYDAVSLAAQSLSSDPLPARVIILLTDGHDVSSKSSLGKAISQAREAGAAIYPVAIVSGPDFSPDALQALARGTGGTYYATSSSSALTQIYSSISEELKRTWQLQYVTAAVPGERVSLEASVQGQKASAPLVIPGHLVQPAPTKPVLPKALLDSNGGLAVFALAVGLLVLLAVAFLGASRKGAWVRSRLAPHVASHDAERKRRRGERQRFAFASGLFQATERALGHLKQWQALQRTIERADLPLRTVEFVYVMAASGIFVGFLAAAGGFPPIIAFLCLIGGAFLPYAFVAYKARKRIRDFENQLPDLLVTMAASLKAGHSFRQGIQSVVDEGQDPASKEFQRVLTETRLGRPMDEALTEMTYRVGSKNFDFVISAVTIQRQIGGSLASLFDMVADTVRQRQQFQRKIRGLTAMGRMSAYVLIGLPFFVLGVVTLINSEYMTPLYHSSTGHKLLITMLVMMAIGSVILRKIVSFKG
ncbi:MAG: VWA domain-containing protein [Actinobacteria bacterium]|nr:MAG: VWA domain-containing protein [Actinomycetota bacterium]